MNKIPIATSFFRRFVGLMCQPMKSLWIPKCKQVHTYFMRFSLDVYFIDINGVVIDCCYDLRPFCLSHYVPHAYGVLEVPVEKNKRYCIGSNAKAPWALNK